MSQEKFELSKDMNIYANAKGKLKHRVQGLSSLVMEHLVRGLLDEKKDISLLYDNPKSGKKYRRIGFMVQRQFFRCMDG